MLTQGAYDFVIKGPHETPGKVSSELPQVIDEMLLGGPVSVLLPELVQAFPQAVAAMEIYWEKPVVVFKQVIGQWLSYIVLEKQEKNLFFNLNTAYQNSNDADFEYDYRMLPLEWRSLYRRLDGFVITESSVVPLGWKNTPSPFAARLTLEEYRQKVGGKKADTRQFESMIGSSQLVCWLWTESGDALFLDEEHCDRKVYHVKGTAFGDATVLEQPTATLDEYLTHVISGRLINEFLF